MFPCGNLGFELPLGSDASVKALTAQHAALDLDNVQPVGVLGDVVEFQSAQHPLRLCGGEDFAERPGGVGREIVEDDTDYQ